MKGKFIVFEGIDGCGKSLQTELLRQNPLFSSCIFTKEHTTGVVGQLIDKVLQKKIILDPLALQLLFVADRIDHLKTLIQPSLDQGLNVISDRYFWSTVAYGSLVADKKWLLQINKSCLIPDLVILLDLPPHVALQRISHSRLKKSLFEKMTTLSQVRKNYLWLARRFANTCLVVDATQSPEKIHEIVAKAIASFQNPSRASSPKFHLA